MVGKVGDEVNTDGASNRRGARKIIRLPVGQGEVAEWTHRDSGSPAINSRPSQLVTSRMCPDLLFSMIWNTFYSARTVDKI